jgi:ligand-binding SRPBCC domain-containing protein
MSERTVRQTSTISAPLDAVWRRVTTFEGINDELRPVMRMRVPAGLQDTAMDTVPLGVPLGRSWLFYLGFLPLDYDDLTVTELVPRSHFQEVSTMGSMRRWTHRRELNAVDAGHTEVTDVVGFEPRLTALAGLVEPVVRELFAHRHRRLARHFADH